MLTTADIDYAANSGPLNFAGSAGETKTVSVTVQGDQKVELDETFFVTDVGAAMENIEALWTVRAEAYGGDPKVSQTMLQVGGLVMPELMIEIKVIASV